VCLVYGKKTRWLKLKLYRFQILIKRNWFLWKECGCSDWADGLNRPSNVILKWPDLVCWNLGGRCFATLSVQACAH
jgi:hypothetical protein